MAPQQNGAKPKRKRQRRRRQMSSDESSSSSDSSSEEETPLPVKLPTPSASSSSSESESSSSESSSSESESSDDGRGRRRGRGKATQQQQQAASTSTTAPTSTARRPYPSRSPSPASFNPANVALGQSIFPLLKPLGSGPIFDGLVPGDANYASTSAETLDEDRAAKEKAREEKFGNWWRARLVSEFEGELGDLAAEPGLTAPRLSLLLTSLTSLSSLHSTSSSLAASSNSIWLHDPSAALDPLSSLNVEEGAEEWSKSKVGGEGDIEVGEEGVSMGDKEKKVDAEAEGMEVDDE